jgi:hypothetical protein
MDGGRAPSARGRRSRGRCQLTSDDRVRFSAERGRAVLLPIPSRGAGWRYIRDRSVTPGSLGSGLASPQAERERDSGHECPRTESRRAPSRVSSTSASCVPPQRARPHHRREWRAATVPADLTHPDLRQRSAMSPELATVRRRCRLPVDPHERKRTPNSPSGHTRIRCSYRPSSLRSISS